MPLTSAVGTASPVERVLPGLGRGVLPGTVRGVLPGLMPGVLADVELLAGAVAAAVPLPVVPGAGSVATLGVLGVLLLGVLLLGVLLLGVLLLGVLLLEALLGVLPEQSWQSEVLPGPPSVGMDAGVGAATAGCPMARIAIMAANTGSPPMRRLRGCMIALI